MPTLETSIKKQIKEYLMLTGWYVYHNLQGLGCYPGLSDFVAVKDGQTVWIEVKTPKGKQSEGQEQFQADIEAHGGKYIVAKGIEDVMCLNNNIDLQGMVK
jgi:hypothetical protein